MPFTKKHPKLPKKFPHTLKNGSVRVKVYRIPNKKSSTGFTFIVRWFEGRNCPKDKRMVRLEDAMDFAERQADYLNSAKYDADRLRRDQKEAYVLAQDLAGDTPVVTAIREWKKAKEISGGNLIAAAEAWRDQRPTDIGLFEVNEIIKRFKVAKERAGIIWKSSYQKTFPKFQREFGDKPISKISTPRLQEWLDTTYKHHTTRNTHRKRIVVLWRWAQKQGYLPRNIKTEAELTERAKEPTPERGIISPQTFWELLYLMKGRFPHYLPALVLAGFCGLRCDEVHKQKWEDIRLEEFRLRVTRAKSGTASYRHVQICPAAVEWLLVSHQKRVGRVCRNEAITRIRAIARKRGILLPANCFRHSFVSYLIAKSESIEVATLEAGHTERVAHKNYKELVTKADAEEWFSILPGDTNGKVVNFERGG